MAKLVRTTQKIFAGNAPANQVTAFGSIKDGSPSYTKAAYQIMNSNFESGWSDAVEDDYAPYRQDRNAVDLALSTQIAYILQEGIAEWDSGTTYYSTSVVKYLDGSNLKFYRSIAANNTSALTDTTKWALFMTVSNTGDVTLNAIVPTQTAGDNSTKAASTAFVTAAIAALNGAISSVKTSNLSASRALTSSAGGKIAVSATTSTELGYVHGVTSKIQTQLDSKAGLTSNNDFTGTNDFSQSPTMPTPSASDNSTKGATTAFVKTAVSNVRVYPDYANAYDLTKANGTAPANGFIYAQVINTGLSINGLSINPAGAYGIYTACPILLPVKQGDSYSSSNWGYVNTFKFIPERN